MPLSYARLSFLLVLFAVIASGCSKENPAVKVADPVVPEPVVPPIEAPPEAPVISRYCHVRFGADGKESLWLVYDGKTLLTHRNEKAQDTQNAQVLELVEGNPPIKRFRLAPGEGAPVWLKGAEFEIHEEPREVLSMMVEVGGGTVLAFDLPPKKAMDAKPIDVAALAEAIKRRIDPDDIRNVVVRPANPMRVEIVLPVGNARPKEPKLEEVDQIKRLIEATGGMLSFQILAHQQDDATAYAFAQGDGWKEFRKAMLNDEFLDAAILGIPPPFPKNDSGGKAFTIKTNGQERSIRYQWVQLSDAACRDWKLDNAHETDQEGGSAWKQMEASRIDHRPRILKNAAGEAALFFSRVVENRKLTEEQRAKKKYEYFILVRSSSQDTLDADGVDVNFSAGVDTDTNMRPAITLTFNKEGARRFAEITRSNKPEMAANLRRQLAIVLDGEVLSHPAILSEIGERCQITGDFGKAEVDRLVQILRAGAIFAPLHHRPASIVAIGPGQPTGKKFGDLEASTMSIVVKAMGKTFQASSVRFDSNPEAAPRLHFGGLLAFDLIHLEVPMRTDPDALKPRIRITARIGTPGPTPGDFVSLKPVELARRGSPVAEVEIPASPPTDKSRIVRIDLNQAENDEYVGMSEPLPSVPSGKLKVTLTFPGSKDEPIAPLQREVEILR